MIAWRWRILWDQSASLPYRLAGLEPAALPAAMNITFPGDYIIIGISDGPLIRPRIALRILRRPNIEGVGQEIGDNAGYGFGLDLGFQYQTPYVKGLVVGFSSNDLIQPSIKLVEVKDKYQTATRFGIAYGRTLRQNMAATAVFEIEKITGRDNKLHPGIEMAFYDKYFIRGGADDDRATLAPA